MAFSSATHSVQDALPAPLRRSRGMRWLGDIHGSLQIHDAIREARAQDFAIGFIGDLTDQSPSDGDAPNDSAAIIRTLLELDAQGLALITPGNHCFKLLRYLTHWREGDGGEQRLQLTHGLDRTIAEIMAAPDRDTLIEGYLRVVGAAPLWRQIGPYLFVHAAAAPAMFTRHAPSAAHALTLRGDGLVHRALYGQTAPNAAQGALPIRLYDWASAIPARHTVVIGHDRVPDVQTTTNPAGGQLVRIDTGAGKGGRLSWIDIDAQTLAFEAPGAIE
ncbi:hypothetical protein MTR62_11210 [Novosphingobium sp. 1949]|uniref:Calcineurin-like phosphoesterase domain-containing protein n=1 Tax=Novosphingobium organovorum TaxID=2930092 RepID=A0ABT0BEP0_9SPHN|nr:hypothetical protein [Novosphingobium organovorum]MCJ2183256.1 hypothetical protein [Novosphingobium organovorum]